MKTKQQNQKPSKMVQMLRMLAPKAQKLPQVIKTNGIYSELTSYYPQFYSYVTFLCYFF